MWLFWPRHFLSALLLAAKRDWIAHTSERSHVVSPRRSHTRSRCQNKKGRKSDRGSVALLPFSWTENIKQPSHRSDCFSKCLSVWDFHLLDGGFILEELLILFNCLSQAELPGLQWQRSIAHSKTEVVYFVRHLTCTHMHAHTHTGLSILSLHLRDELMLILVLLVAYRIIQSGKNVRVSILFPAAAMTLLT